MINLIWIIILAIISGIALILVGISATRTTPEDYFGITKIEAEMIERELEKELRKIEVE